jgi:hypothetical protein
MGAKGALVHFLSRHGQPVTIVKAQSDERVSARGLKNQLEGGECFQFLPDDNVNVERGDRLIQDMTGDQWVVTDVRSEVIGGEVAWKAAFVMRPGVAPKEPSLVQNLNLEGATIGALAVGGQVAVAWGNAAIAAHGQEVADILEEMSKAIAGDEGLSDDTKHDLQVDIRSIANELTKREPWAEAVLRYVGHLANIASLTELAHKLGSLLAAVGIR